MAIVQSRILNVEMTEVSNSATKNLEHIFCMQTGLNIVSKLQKTFTLNSTANFKIKKDFGYKKSKYPACFKKTINQSVLGMFYNGSIIMDEYPTKGSISKYF